MLTIFEEIVRMKKAGLSGMLVTVIEKKGHGPAIVGKKMLVNQSRQKIGTIGGGELESLALAKAGELIENKAHLVQSYNLSVDAATNDKTVNMACGGRVTLYFEYIAPMPQVFIFGAGNVGRCLAGCLQNLNYLVTVVDNRAQIPEALPGVHKILTGDYAEAVDRENIHSGCYVVISGYNHEVDYQVLRAIYRRNQLPRYIGLLASPKKAELILTNLMREFGQAVDLSAIHAPIGLDIGGQTPEEIALAIAAELQAVNYGKKAHAHLTRDWPNIIRQ